MADVQHLLWRFLNECARFKDWNNSVLRSSGSGSGYLTGTLRLEIAWVCTADHTMLIRHFSISSEGERRAIALEVVGSNPTSRSGS